jgi:predicted nucleic acid-binding protein
MARKRRVYFDSNIIVYMLEGDTEHQRKSLEMVDAAERHGASICTSEVAIAECLSGPKKAGNATIAVKYMDMFNNPQTIQVLPVSRSVLLKAADIVGQSSHKLVDAIHLATAMESGCEVFFTNDRGIRQVPGGPLVLYNAADWE